MKLTNTHVALFTALVLSVACYDVFAEQSVTVGLFTEHYHNDSDDYNENNKLVKYTYYFGSVTYTLATFENSHYIRSHMIGIGKRWKLSEDSEASITMGAIEGYQAILKTHVGDVIFIPIFSVKTGFIRTIILGPVVNIGVEYAF